MNQREQIQQLSRALFDANKELGERKKTQAQEVDFRREKGS
jgi:hypothetical protein